MLPKVAFSIDLFDAVMEAVAVVVAVVVVVLVAVAVACVFLLQTSMHAPPGERDFY